MTNPPSFEQESEFQREHAKRERHITPEQQRVWADSLLKKLPDSLAYQATCTPQARQTEERKLNLHLEMHLHSKQLQQQHPTEPGTE